MTASTASVDAPPMSLRRSVLVLGSLSVFGPLSMDLYLPSLPELASHLDTTDTLAQATMSACMIGLGLGQLVAGPLSDRIGRKLPLVVGVALFAILSLACALAPTIEVLLAVRFLQGLAGAAGMVVSMAMARDMFNGPDLSRMLSLLSLVSSSAPIIAPVIGGQLARFMDWRGIFVVLAGIGAALFLVAVLALRETLPDARRHTGGARIVASQFRTLMSDRLFIGVIVVGAFSSTAFFAYLSMSSFVFQNQFGVSPAMFSLIFAGNSVAVLIGAQINGVFVRRTGPRRMYVLAITASAIASLGLLAVVLAGWSLVPFIVALSVLMLSQGLSGPNSTTIALHEHGERAGTAASVLGTTMFVVGPIVVPIVSLAGASGLALAATMSAATIAAAVLVWSAIRPMLLRRGR